MSAIFHLARLYVLGSVRRQAHLATLFLGTILFMLPAYVNSFSLGVEAFEVVSNDFGLILIGYFLVGMGLHLGSTTVPADREARSLYPVLARPISRGGYLAAHFLALMSLLAGSALFLGTCLWLSVGLMTRHHDPSIFLGVFSSCLQASVVAAICLALSVRISPAAAGTLGVMVFFVGHLSKDLYTVLLGSPLLASLAKAALPDFSALAVKAAVVSNVPVPLTFLLFASLYALGWVGLAFFLGRAAFEEVDL